MNYRPTTLVFTEAPRFLPAGAPLSLYEVIADSNHVYEIDALGALIRRDKFQGTRWVSSNFTGSFSLTTIPKHRDSVDMYILYIVDGVVNFMQSIIPREPTPLDAAKWRWQITDLMVDLEGVESVKSYQGCLKLIHHAEVTNGYKNGAPEVDAMLALALCKPELLPTKTARESFELLADHQLRAISSWHKSRAL